MKIQMTNNNTNMFVVQTTVPDHPDYKIMISNNIYTSLSSAIQIAQSQSSVKLKPFVRKISDTEWVIMSNEKDTTPYYVTKLTVL